MKVVCPNCNHIQVSKSKLKRITCSSCGKKFYPENIYSNEEDLEEQINKEIEKEEKDFNDHVKKLKLD